MEGSENLSNPLQFNPCYKNCDCDDGVFQLKIDTSCLCGLRSDLIITENSSKFKHLKEKLEKEFLNKLKKQLKIIRYNEKEYLDTLNIDYAYSIQSGFLIGYANALNKIESYINERGVN